MLSKRMRDIKSFIVMDILEKTQRMERAGDKIIHLEVGEPDFDTPEPIKAAAIEAIKEGETHYTHSQGLIELREAICNHYSGQYGIKDLEPDQVMVTSGTSPAFLVALAAVLNTGDEVIISDPHYACYPNFVRFLGGRVRTIPVYEEDGFQYRPEAIRASLTSSTRAILINSPANPTGNLLSKDRMMEIADIDRMVISDEIYHGLVYEGQAHSMLEFTDRCIVVNGFSKLYAMTGWRLGYLIVPKDMVKPMRAMMQNLFISANSIAQRAAIVALKDPEVRKDIERMRRIYNERRQFMIKLLREIGFGIAVEPTGAFYVFANAHRFTSDSYRFAFEILDRAKVGVTPGIDFGANGEGYIRFSYANRLENIKEGLNRIASYLGSS